MLVRFELSLYTHAAPEKRLHENQLTEALTHDGVNPSCFPNDLEGYDSRASESRNVHSELQTMPVERSDSVGLTSPQPAP